jgi:hypothetical protein
LSHEPAGFDYRALLRSSLLALVRGVLARAATEGLPGDHHFYLTFGTAEPGVAIAPRLRKQHPDEMTIVLQHQFSGLAVGDDGFSVTLRFGGSPERVTVPWEALRAFADPSAGFGVTLRAEPAEAGTEAAAAPGRAAFPARAETGTAREPGSGVANVVDFGAYRRRSDGPEA